MIKQYNKADAMDYLEIDLQLFNHYDSRSLILYTLVNGRRLYSQKVLDNFKSTVLTRSKVA